MSESRVGSTPSRTRDSNRIIRVGWHSHGDVRRPHWARAGRLGWASRHARASAWARPGLATGIRHCQSLPVTVPCHDDRPAGPVSDGRAPGPAVASNCPSVPASAPRLPAGGKQPLSGLGTTVTHWRQSCKSSSPAGGLGAAGAASLPVSDRPFKFQIRVPGPGRHYPVSNSSCKGPSASD
jgi:hypothetical protein